MYFYKRVDVCDNYGNGKRLAVILQPSSCLPTTQSAFQHLSHSPILTHIHALIVGLPCTASTCSSRHFYAQSFTHPEEPSGEIWGLAPSPRTVQHAAGAGDETAVLELVDNLLYFLSHSRRCTVVERSRKCVTHLKQFN